MTFEELELLQCLRMEPDTPLRVAKYAAGSKKCTAAEVKRYLVAIERCQKRGLVYQVSAEDARILYENAHHPEIPCCDHMIPRRGYIDLTDVGYHLLNFDQAHDPRAATRYVNHANGDQAVEFYGDSQRACKKLLKNWLALNAKGHDYKRQKPWFEKVGPWLFNRNELVMEGYRATLTERG